MEVLVGLQVVVMGFRAIDSDLIVSGGRGGAMKGNRVAPELRLLVGEADVGDGGGDDGLQFEVFHLILKK